MVERYPNLKQEVGSSIPDDEISSLLDRKKLAKWSIASCALALAYRPSVSTTKEAAVTDREVVDIIMSTWQ